VVQRGHIVADANALAGIEIGDVHVVLLPVGSDDPVGSERSRTAVRVVDDGDVLDAEQMLCDGHRAKRVDAAASRDDHREERRRRRHFLLTLVADDLPGVDLAEGSRNRLRDPDSARIVAIDNDRP